MEFLWPHSGQYCERRVIAGAWPESIKYCVRHKCLGDWENARSLTRDVHIQFTTWDLWYRNYGVILNRYKLRSDFIRYIFVHCCGSTQEMYNDNLPERLKSLMKTSRTKEWVREFFYTFVSIRLSSRREGSAKQQAVRQIFLNNILIGRNANKHTGKISYWIQYLNTVDNNNLFVEFDCYFIWNC